MTSLWVTACSFSPGRLGSADGTQQSDAALTDDAAADAALDAPGDAAVVAVTTDHPSTSDTFLASDVPTVNFNTQPSALVDGDIQRVVLIRFDLSTISTSAIVSAAEMHIWTDYDGGAMAVLYPALESWTEGEATWNERSTGVAWTTAGAAPPSRGTATVGTVTGAATYTEYVIPIDVSTVNGWVTAPTSNHGLVFVTTNADGTRFSTREVVMTSSPPFLRVTHAP